MKKEHSLILKEITDDIELMSIVGGDGGSGQWETGAAGIYTGIMGGLGYSCSFPEAFYGSGDTTSTGAGTCMGGYIVGGYGGMGGSGGYSSGATSTTNTGS